MKDRQLVKPSSEVLLLLPATNKVGQVHLLSDEIALDVDPAETRQTDPVRPGEQVDRRLLVRLRLELARAEEHLSLFEVERPHGRSHSLQKPK